MMITIALFALFATALCASVLSLLDTWMRGRNAYRALSAQRDKANQSAVTLRVILPSNSRYAEQSGSPALLKLAA